MQLELSRPTRSLMAVVPAMLATVGLLVASAPVVRANPSDPSVGSAGTYAVLAASTVTNTGATAIQGDVGLSPGSAVTGFPPAVISGGTLHVDDGPAVAAAKDAGDGYTDAAGRSATSVAVDLVGRTLVAGTYGAKILELSGQLTLDGQGDPSSVFILQSSSTLVTATASQVTLINGANACHVYWQVGSSATLGTGSDFTGTVLAQESITANTNVTVDGRLIALDGAVTMDTDTVNNPACVAAGGGSAADSSTGTTTATTTSGSAGTTTGTADGADAQPGSPSTTDSAGSSTSSGSGTNPIGPAVNPASTATTTPATSSPTPSPGKLAATSNSLTSGGGSDSVSKRPGHRQTSDRVPRIPTGQLAFTGAHVGGLLSVGTMMTLLGVLAVALGRRRASHVRSPGLHRRV